LGIVSYQFECNGGPLGSAHGVDNAQLRQAAFQSNHVLFKAKGLAAIDRHNLVNAIAKNKSTVHHAYFGVVKLNEGTVEIAG
jgi:hypothetical protein